MQEIDYADMLEIPVSTMSVTKKKSKKKKEEVELKDKVVEAVNERVEGVLMDSIVEYGEENTTVLDGGNALPPIRTPKDKKVKKEKNNGENAFKKFLNSKLLLAEFIVICVLVGTIFLTNVFYQNSAINTFFSNMFGGNTQAEAVDNRSYDKLTLGGIVNDATITCSITDKGVMTVKAKCSIYAPHDGKIEKTEKLNNGTYAVTVAHTTKFSTVFTGLTYAYGENGSAVCATIPIGYTDGSNEVQVTMYNEGAIISSYTVNSDNSIVWKK